ncbi:MAG: Spy/CpxP family protein refolding chaperone [Leptolyngbyaceae cyanobacterium MO_188.B28]|nr:Spy/CpxP family protein refolding chaperone [Leptolyngbyaceae cyanobacterium MO_188.B28]
MTLRRSLLITAAAILVPMGSAFALTETQFNSPNLIAQRAAGNGGRSQGFQEGRWLEQIDLSAEQTERIQAIREETKQTMEPLREQLRQERDMLQSQMAGDRATDEQLRAQHQKIQDLHQQLGVERFETMLAIRQVLTSEQRAEMAELMEQRREQRRQGQGYGGRFGGGRN